MDFVLSIDEVFHPEYGVVERVVLRVIRRVVDLILKLGKSIFAASKETIQLCRQETLPNSLSPRALQFLKKKFRIFSRIPETS